MGDYVNAQLGFEVFQERLEATRYLAKLEANKDRLAIPGNDIASSLEDDLLSDATVLIRVPLSGGHPTAFVGPKRKGDQRLNRRQFEGLR